MADRSIITKKAEAEILAGTIQGRSVAKPVITQSATGVVTSGTIEARPVEHYSLLGEPVIAPINTGTISGRSIYKPLFTEPASGPIDCDLALANYKLIAKALLSVDLAPGESVTMDSENYTIESYTGETTWMHTGTWLDELNRDTAFISVQPSNGSISSEIEYRERFL